MKTYLLRRKNIGAIILFLLAGLLGGKWYLHVTEPTQIFPVPITNILAPIDIDYYIRGEALETYQIKKPLRWKSDSFIIVSPPKDPVIFMQIIEEHIQQNPVDFSQYNSLSHTFYQESFRTPRDWGYEDSVTIEEQEHYPLIEPKDRIFDINWKGEGGVHYSFKSRHFGGCPSDIYFDGDGENMKITGNCTGEERAMIGQALQSLLDKRE